VFHLSATEGFFVRIDTEVARLARSTAEERQMPLRELVERALRQHIAEITEPEQRAAALHAMEDALLGRMDRRLGQHFERVAGLYAREAFDVAQTLDLVKRLLTYSARDREILQKHLSESRVEATRHLKQRADWQGGTDPEVEEALKKARELAGQWEAYAKSQEAAKTRLEQENQKLKADLKEQQLRAGAIQERFAWAVKQFEAQRGLSRRPLSEFLAQYDRERPTPV
jgi:hypothetical protein